jgi:protein-S-isoprenylcysteine O-methyltransferase Ste14
MGLLMNYMRHHQPVLFRAVLRVPVPWVFVIAYLGGVGLEQAFRRGHANSTVLTAMGIAVFATGVAIAGWGWFLFHRAHTTTTPGEAPAAFVTRGPYRVTRNPMYLGLVIAYIGEAAILNQVWPVAVLPLVIAYVNWIVIPVEEEKLEEVVGSEYQQYCGRVRRWL